MDHRGFDIATEYLADLTRWTAHASAYPGLFALGDTEAEAVAKLREVINGELAWQKMYPDGAPYMRVAGRFVPDDLPGYTLEDAVAAVGPGWATLVTAAHRRLTAAGARIAQVKEKFGGLRIYYEYAPIADDMTEGTRSRAVLDRWAGWMEHRSFSVCEACGAAGTEVKRHGWYRTLCAACDRRWQAGARTWADIRGDRDIG